MGRVTVYSAHGGCTHFPSPERAAKFIVNRYGRHVSDIEIGASRSLFEETWREVDRLLTVRPSTADEALTQIQHIAYDAQIQHDRGEGTHEEQLRMAIAKLERICNIAESCEPDENWRPLIDEDHGDVHAGGDSTTTAPDRR